MIISIAPRITGFSLFSLCLGALSFGLALTPGLVPHSGVVQGALAGACFAAGYGIGVVAGLIWGVLGLPVWRAGTRLRRGGVVVIGAMLLAAIWWHADAQQDLRQMMGLAADGPLRIATLALTALPVAGVLLLLGRLFRIAMLAGARGLSPLLPERLALLLGFLIAALVFSFIGNDLIVRHVLQAFDASYQALDETLPATVAQPQNPQASGSAASLIHWNEIGNEGRNRVLDPLDATAISAVTGRPARDPLRIYVGLGSADTPEARARLALDEAIRIGAFDRKVLVIATPTGTGWIDPAAMMPLEVLTGGDVATVSVQYSYLPSWLSLLTVPEYGEESARAVFAAIHGYWRDLPPDRRPQLYLFGLSLGSRNSDLSADIYDLIAAPYQGALWAGPPFGSRSWVDITRARVPGSPEWLPRFRDGSVVRFLNQYEMPDRDRPWGPLRIVYLQYASDPITFFSPSILWREPDWMKAPRGRDVSPDLRWIPVVTFLQIGFDVMTATTTPRGFGHVYAGADYLNGWLALLSPDADAAMLARLRAAMVARGI
ncbi:MAG TPA: alpha/beta-hydrolase family protein [Paenirhodobacter sp.]